MMLLRNSFLPGILLTMCVALSLAQATEFYKIGPSGSSIQGSVKYIVVGRYQAGFERFEGALVYDPQLGMIRAVTLKIDAASIKSAFPALDKAVHSPTLLNTKKFPDITFESKSVAQTPDGFLVKGTLSMHGVKREVEFPFKAEKPVEVNGEKTIIARGKWTINRRDFGVIWSPVLDRGGVIVGNHLTVEWQVAAVQE